MGPLADDGLPSTVRRRIASAYDLDAAGADAPQNGGVEGMAKPARMGCSLLADR